MKNIKILFTLFLAISLLSSCQKDSIFTEVEMEPPTPEINLETTINGFVTDQSGAPIADALVSVSNNTILTNELGFFEITSLVNAKFAVIKIEKTGYFDQFETLTPSPSRSAKNRTRIQMIERNSSGSFSSASGGTVAIGSASKVVFQANSFIDEAGNPYSGGVTIYTFFIDPTDNDIDQIMPGNLMAINAQEETNVLQSFGMINVELEGDAGQALNINQPATIEVGVPTSIIGNAPESIPLWYFDETDGLWKEEGSATLEGGKYVGTVNHFTFWNCDVPGEFTLINGQIVDPRGVSIVQIRITDLFTGASFNSFKESEGLFTGGVPQNTDLLFEVLSFCGDNDAIFSANIGPFMEESADLGIFEVTDEAVNFTLISGSLVDCNQIPISNGQVFFTLPNQSFTQQMLADEFGNFTALVPSCDMEEIEIRGVDLSDGLVSQIVTVVPTSGNTDAGTIEVCTNISAVLGSVIINIDGEQKIFDNCTLHITDNGNDTIGYRFTYYEVLPPENDSLIYYFLLRDNNNDLSNPDWSASPISSALDGGA